jgi:hypothetical protein
MLPRAPAPQAEKQRSRRGPIAENGSKSRSALFLFGGSGSLTAPFPGIRCTALYVSDRRVPFECPPATPAKNRRRVSRGTLRARRMFSSFLTILVWTGLTLWLLEFAIDLMYSSTRPHTPHHNSDGRMTSPREAVIAGSIGSCFKSRPPKCI